MFSLNDLEDRDVHLTNDAVQDKNKNYGIYEPGNKVSQKDFATYLKNYKNEDFESLVLPQMRRMIQDTLEAYW